MKRPSLAGWKNPKTRPRYIIWTGVAVFAAAGILVGAVMATSSYWFCANVCHVVMDDAIAAYNTSPHANVTCIHCHSKIGLDPVSFLLHKAEFGIDGVYKVATNTYHTPPNPESEVAIETVREQCTQCHAGYKSINPSPGMKIDHDAHKEAGVTCTVCHNRVAHRETHPLKLKDSVKHADFMQMEGCFRCHSQEREARAPGRCEACHTKDFELVPASHVEKAFYTPFGDSTGHAELARNNLARLAEVESETAAAETTGSEAQRAHGEEEGHEIPSIETVSYCGQCHPTSFCDGCHGTQIPHPEKFKKDHAQQAFKNPESCGKCHAASKAAAKSGEFCSDCHHKVGDESKPWFGQHFVYARKDAKACLKCHTTMYCETCHVSGKPKVPF